MNLKLEPETEKKNKRKKNVSCIDYLCCMCDSEEEDEVGRNRNSLGQKNAYRMTLLGEERKEKMELQLLGNLSAFGNYALVRVTQKNFFVDLMQKKAQMMMAKQNQSNVTQPLNNTNKSIYFSSFNRGIKIDNFDQTKAIPEKVLKYLAKRCVSGPRTVVWDAFAQNGAFVIQAALEDDIQYVIGFEKNAQLIKNCANNVGVYGVKNLVDFVKTSFEKQRFMKGPDCLYLHLDYSLGLQGDFVLIRDTKPLLSEVIPAALKVSKNLVFILPKQTNVQDITILFTYYFTLNNVQKIKIVLNLGNQINLRYNYFKSMEICLITLYISVMYQWQIVQINYSKQTQLQDECEFISNFLQKDQTEKKFLESTFRTVKLALSRQGLRKTLEQAIMAEEQSQIQTLTVLQLFLNQLMKEKCFDHIEIEQLYQTEDVDFIFQQATPQYQELSHHQGTFDPYEQSKMTRFQSKTSNDQLSMMSYVEISKTKQQQLQGKKPALISFNIGEQNNTSMNSPKHGDQNENLTLLQMLKTQKNPNPDFQMTSNDSFQTIQTPLLRNNTVLE